MRLLIHDYAGHPFQVQLSRELARRGHAVTHAFAGGLLTPRGSLVKSVDDPDHFELVEVPMDANYRRDKYRFFRRRRMELAYGRQVATLIEKTKPEVVISANTPTEPQLDIARTCAQFKIGFIPWVQDFYSIAVTKLAQKKLPVVGHIVGWWYRLLEKRTFRMADKIVVITSDFVPILQEFGVPAAGAVVIPNWAPLDELPQLSRQNAWSTAHGLDGKFVFLYSGTLAMKHNPDILRQLALTFRDDPQVRVLVISEGPGAEFLADCKRTERLDNLEILPFQPFSEVPNINATADVLLAILETDAGIFSVPSKVLTYLCAGRPILAAIPGGNLASRIITSCRAGIAVEPGNIDSFLQAARSLREKPAARQLHAEAARAYAEEHFNVADIASRFEACFKRTPGESHVQSQTTRNPVPQPTSNVGGLV